VSTIFYKLGVRNALRQLSISPDESNRKGTPFPEKNPAIGAEALARLFQEQDDEPNSVGSENGSHTNNLDRAVSWGSSANIDDNQTNAGMMLPGNPRG